MKIGILALQGAFREHRRALERLGAEPQEVRLPRHLSGLAGLIVPGGESTTMGKLMRAYELDDAIRAFHAAGGAVWGTCAGAILVATTIRGRPEQPTLDLIDLEVARNDYGRQVASFEADLTIDGLNDPFRAVFIRAPRIVRCGPQVQVLGRYRDDPVAVAEGRVLATVFHPELSRDDRFHALFLRRLEAVADAPLSGASAG